MIFEIQNKKNEMLTRLVVPSKESTRHAVVKIIFKINLFASWSACISLITNYTVHKNQKEKKLTKYCIVQNFKLYKNKNKKSTCCYVIKGN